MTKSKEELLQELEELGYDPLTGRKHRSDAGIKRGPNSHIRSDAGTSKNCRVLEPVVLYSRVLNNLLKDTRECVQVQKDINDIYLPIVRPSTVQMVNHNVVTHGVSKARTVKHIAGYTTDLEKYRFEALQSIASGKKPESRSRETIVFSPEISATKQAFKEIEITWLDVFCLLYHIKEEDYLLWTYKKWRQDYDIVCDEHLSNDFTFDISHRPGSESFRPDLAGKVMAKYQEKIEAFKQTKEYINKRAVTRDRITNKYLLPLKTELSNKEENAGLSLSALDKKARSLLPQEQIDKEIEEVLEQYVESKVKGENDD